MRQSSLQQHRGFNQMNTYVHKTSDMWIRWTGQMIWSGRPGPDQTCWPDLNSILLYIVYVAEQKRFYVGTCTCLLSDSRLNQSSDERLYSLRRYIGTCMISDVDVYDSEIWSRIMWHLYWLIRVLSIYLRRIIHSGSFLNFINLPKQVVRWQIFEKKKSLVVYILFYGILTGCVCLGGNVFFKKKELTSCRIMIILYNQNISSNWIFEKKKTEMTCRLYMQRGEYIENVQFGTI